MGVNGFARAAGVDRNTARIFIDKYFAEFSGVATYMEQEKKKAYAQGYVETIFGRRRPLPDIRSGIPMLRAQAERMAINHPVQGTAADIIKLAMIHLREYMLRQDADIRLLLQVHDELVFEIKEGSASKHTPQIKKLMEQAHHLAVPLTVDAKSGKNWQDTDPLH
jgi:DNA polymerase-1